MSTEVLIAIVSTSAFSALTILVLTCCLDWRRRRGQARGYLSGIQLEIAYASECADEYVSRIASGKPVWSPNYRTITEFTRAHLPWLTAERYLCTEETNQLFRFLTRATEMNRSLDLLESFTSVAGYKVPSPARGETREEKETSRMNAKCMNMLGQVANQRVGCASEAWNASATALRRISRHRLRHRDGAAPLVSDA